MTDAPIAKRLVIERYLRTNNYSEHKDGTGRDMRWKYEKAVIPHRYEVRHNWRFAFLPITLGNETRWLEWCLIAEVCYSSGYKSAPHWEPVEFVDCG